MSNSSLVSYTKLSPNYSNRTEKISKITVHYMAGNLSVETCGEVFAPSSRQASSNYGIGSDGRVGMYVPEDKRAWTSSSAWNDQRAVTIEVANTDSYGTFTTAAWNTLIDLAVDICKRNGITSLNFTGDKNGSVTWHCMFSATSCPGQYFKNNTQRFVQEVNVKLAPAKQRTHKLQIWDWSNNTNQKFWYRSLGNNLYGIRSVATNEWISDPNSSTTQTDAETWGGADNGTATDDPRDPQILVFEKVHELGGYYIHPQVAPNLSLDVAGGNTTNGTKVQWYPSNKTLAQEWHFIPADGNAYYIINAATGKALDMKGGGWV